MIDGAPLSLSLTDAAAGKLKELTAGEANPAIGLRVYVYSGGCSGFRYGMMLEDQPTAEDLTIESRGIKVYVDQNSTQYLSGSEIDYLDTLMGAGVTGRQSLREGRKGRADDAADGEVTGEAAHGILREERINTDMDDLGIGVWCAL